MRNRARQAILAAAMTLFAASGAVSAQQNAAVVTRPAGAALPVVRPVIGCEALATRRLDEAVGAETRISASVIDTPKGQFCAVKGTIAPAIGFEVYLPVARWTQRYLQAGCGGLCGSINASIGQAGRCLPATEGEFVVAASDLGHQGRMGAPGEGDFADDPQKRIDFAYRANHLTALAAKALIRAYYGQPQRYAYFSGCSDGGREALMEAQRYPDDFDGISAGAPAMLFQVQNSFWHAWTTAANLRPDGTNILSAAKLPILHATVIAHCDMADGAKDGLLADPRACTPDPRWNACPDGATDTAGCLTREEWAAALRLYAGPSDAAGHRFLPGGAQPGSELLWNVGNGSGRGGPGGGMLANMTKVVYRDPRRAEAQAASFPFTTGQFARVNELHPLNDATDPDLGRFGGHGGKLLMYHGWSDTSIAPMISIAYYQSVLRVMGADATDRSVRLFMVPGMSHCGGGDGFPQIDTLSPLMAWVESGEAPSEIVADRIDDGSRPSGGPDGRGGGLGKSRAVAPYAQPARTPLASRPLYPFPRVARYSGAGDPKEARNWVATMGEAAPLDWYGATLLSPGYQKSYLVRDGRLAQQ